MAEPPDADTPGPASEDDRSPSSGPGEDASTPEKAPLATQDAADAATRPEPDASVQRPEGPSSGAKDAADGSDPDQVGDEGGSAPAPQASGSATQQPGFQQGDRLIVSRPASDPALEPPGRGWSGRAEPNVGPSELSPSLQRPKRAVSYWFLVIVTLVGLALDVVSKQWAKGHFEALPKGEPQQLVLIDGFMSVIFAKNRGGAWGLLQNETEALRRPFFLIVSMIAIVFIVSLYRKLAPGQTALKWGLPLVLSGALGNLADRIFYGYVIDFLDVYVAWGGDIKHWPTFNVADIAICVGVGLMAIDMFTSRKPRRAPVGTPQGGVPPSSSTGPPAAEPASSGAEQARPPADTSASERGSPEAPPGEPA